jgi:signal transduction histidine kinase
MQRAKERRARDYLLAPLRRYGRRVARAAVLEERRRIARDLHDGLAQELAFISSQSQALSRNPTTDRAAQVATAAQRALDESRAAIQSLGREGEGAFASEVAQVAEQLAARAGARVRLDLDPEASATPEQRDQLLRIVREAVTNGVCHGRASTVAVQLGGGRDLRLRVSDDGAGFDPDAAAPEGGRGFGLAGMRERARQIGAELTIRSRIGRGTEVEVVLP